MDDCSLQKLSTKPGQLAPAFKSAHTDYHVTVGSDVESVVFDCLANDSGASYNISVRYQKGKKRILKFLLWLLCSRR